jgi:hypothetical protein
MRVKYMFWSELSQPWKWWYIVDKETKCSRSKTSGPWIVTKLHYTVGQVPARKSLLSGTGKSITFFYSVGGKKNWCEAGLEPLIPDELVDPEERPRAELAVLRPELRQELLLKNKDDI